VILLLLLFLLQTWIRDTIVCRVSGQQVCRDIASFATTIRAYEQFDSIINHRIIIIGSATLCNRWITNENIESKRAVGWQRETNNACKLNVVHCVRSTTTTYRERKN
jgi:hypothetical protein